MAIGIVPPHHTQIEGVTPGTAPSRGIACATLFADLGEEKATADYNWCFLPPRENISLVRHMLPLE